MKKVAQIAQMAGVGLLVMKSGTVTWFFQKEERPLTVVVVGAIVAIICVAFSMAFRGH